MNQSLEIGLVQYPEKRVEGFVVEPSNGFLTER